MPEPANGKLYGGIVLKNIFLILFLVSLQTEAASKKIFNSDIKITPTTASSSVSTGSGVFGGGVGIGGACYVGGTANVAGIATFSGSTASTSNSTGTVLTAGGFASSNTTDASSSTNGGTFTSAGGGAFAKKLYAGQLIGGGTTTNDSPAAGGIGEVLTISNATNNSLSNGTVFSLGSVSLTAGDWDVWGIASFSGTGATSTFTIGAIGTTNTTLGTNGDGTRAQINQNLASQDSNFTVGPFPLKLSGATTYYFNIRADFSAGTVTGKGTLYARRRR